MVYYVLHIEREREREPGLAGWLWNGGSVPKKKRKVLVREKSTFGFCVFRAFSALAHACCCEFLSIASHVRSTTQP